MVSRKLAQRTNVWLDRFEFFYTYSCVNGLCFGYFQIFPKRSQFDLKNTLTLPPPPYVSRLSGTIRYNMVLSCSYGISHGSNTKPQHCRVKKTICLTMK